MAEKEGNVSVRLNELRCFRRAGRYFCVLTAYFDESYNSRTLCIGGWLCSDAGWNIIEPKWDARITYENRMSAKKGMKAISRYHASDCASRVGEFEGWTEDRQISLVKRLLDILEHGKPYDIVGVAHGVSLDDIATVWPMLSKKDLKWEAYKICMAECFVYISEIMQKHLPNERVTVIHDRGEYDQAAKSAFDDMFLCSNLPHHKYFVTIAPGSWEDFTALQSADLIAFDGFKLADRHRQGKMDIRKSLQSIVGRKMTIRAGYFAPEAMRDLAGVGMTLSKLAVQK